MKLSRDAHGRFLLRVNLRERICLEAMLELYPLIPADHHQITRSNPAVESKHATQAREFLVEDIQAQKARHRAELDRLFQDRARYARDGNGATLRVEPDQVEWLLQVLNDVRVGSWLKLGAPDSRARRPLHLNRANARLYMAMELSGLIQVHFLRALAQTG